MLGQVKYRPNNSYVIDDTIFGEYKNDSYSNSKRCIFDIGSICRLEDCTAYYRKCCMAFKCPFYTTEMNDQYVYYKPEVYASKKYLKEKRKKTQQFAEAEIKREKEEKNRKKEERNRIIKAERKQKLMIEQALKEQKKIEQQRAEEKALEKATRKMAEFINSKYR